MMPIRRPDPPAGWVEKATQEHQRLAALRQTPQREDIKDGYRDAQRPMWKAQHMKCAWCEEPRDTPYEPVDHYRPCGKAQHAEGAEKADGYWWLAWEWTNLLFTCRQCNGKKGDKFFLADPSKALSAGRPAPGDEQPLLIDPAGAGPHPATLIRFERVEEKGGTVRWRPTPIDDSEHAVQTIFICGLASNRDVRDRHLNQTVAKVAEDLRAADPPTARDWRRVLDLLDQQQQWVLATYDALEQYLSLELRQACPGGWPERTDLPIDADAWAG